MSDISSDEDISIDHLKDYSSIPSGEEIFKYITDIASQLNKTKFKQKLGELYGDDTEKLRRIRENLYKYSCSTKKETPTGRLVRRTNSGNVSASGKLKEDIFIYVRVRTHIENSSWFRKGVLNHEEFSIWVLTHLEHDLYFQNLYKI
ncbi:hypothetical protein SNE40_012887 [Patella caerulea]|uniref:Uncharacterized protein n=1 Tax=Patella caerulea TaxID=87958 RepID=A0AAN8PW74_PATCE